LSQQLNKNYQTLTLLMVTIDDRNPNKKYICDSFKLKLLHVSVLM